MKLQNKKDYIYEYSDLNLFQTRVKILTGDYKDVILEFGSSHVVQTSENTETLFNFDYTLYFKPEKFNSIALRGDKNFEEYLSNLLINIISDRKKDKKEKLKLMEVAIANSTFKGKIKIDSSFYQQKTNIV